MVGSHLESGDASDGPLTHLTSHDASPPPQHTHTHNYATRCCALRSRRIQLVDWSLELCPSAASAAPSAANDLLSGLAGAGAGAGTPLVSAAQGPDDSPAAPAAPATNATAAPAAPAPAPVVAPTGNTTLRAGNTTNIPESDEGLLGVLLDRLDRWGCRCSWGCCGWGCGSGR